MRRGRLLALGILEQVLPWSRVGSTNDDDDDESSDVVHSADEDEDTSVELVVASLAHIAVAGVLHEDAASSSVLLITSVIGSEPRVGVVIGQLLPPLARRPQTPSPPPDARTPRLRLHSLAWHPRAAHRLRLPHWGAHACAPAEPPAP